MSDHDDEEWAGATSHYTPGLQTRCRCGQRATHRWIMWDGSHAGDTCELCLEGDMTPYDTRDRT